MSGAGAINYVKGISGDEPNAVWMSFFHFAALAPDTILFPLPHDAQLIAVCRTGNRSARATASLRHRGLRVENLEGGMKGWKTAGLPMEPEDGVVA